MLEDKHVEHASSSMESMVRAIVEIVEGTGNDLINKFKKDNTITGEDGRRLNKERLLRRDVMTKVCEFITEQANDMPHDIAIDHAIPSKDVPLHIIDEACVGKCMKCSLLYYVNVVYPRDYAEDLMTPLHDEITIQDKIIHVSKRAKGGHVMSSSEVDYASNILSDDDVRVFFDREYPEDIDHASDLLTDIDNHTSDRSISFDTPVDVNHASSLLSED